MGKFYTVFTVPEMLGNYGSAPIIRALRGVRMVGHVAVLRKIGKRQHTFTRTYTDPLVYEFRDATVTIVQGEARCYRNQGRAITELVRRAKLPPIDTDRDFPQKDELPRVYESRRVRYA
jgi:hypothetical protein